ncbi:CgeB family protein [Carboxylicivirga sp. N1Y90]|uniref:CgeB family protein n=1 Tax=Carboxylicivirga fragile TaxID=3417571 RepID=UPI003D345D49|nr:glycosyltransferase [Marinilabiliaceae bacterium N1Y90]
MISRLFALLTELLLKLYQMNYRIVKITTYYKDFLSYYYERFPEVVSQSFDQQYAHLMQQRFAWSDAYAQAFMQQGNQASEIVANAMTLQNQWCEENNFKATDSNSILIAQLKQLQPDVVWFQDSYSYNGEFINKLKALIPTIKIAIGNCCSPISSKYYSDFKAFDFITVCAPYFKNLLEKKGLPECLIIPHAFDKRILKRVPAEAKQHDFLFSGSIILDQRFHEERIQLLENLVKAGVDINLLVNLNQNASKHLLVKQMAFFASKCLNKIGLSSVNKTIKPLQKVNRLDYMPSASKVSKALAQQIKSPVFGIDMFKEMALSKIAFNIHGDIAANFAANMRMYEATGAGTCLLTDWKPDINDYFTDGEEIITYRNLDEATQKIKWLLSEPQELKKITEAGQRRTLNDHTFEKRAEMIDRKIKSLLFNLA